jgi:hypothetical protein
MNSNLSGLLYANSSFIEGMGRTLDIGATMDDYNYAPTGPLADLIALASDWHVISSGLHSSLLEGISRLSPLDRQRLIEYARA